MKYFLLAGLCFCMLVGKAQQLPNGSFENWSIKEEYIEPDGWISTNAYAYFGAPETCYPFEEARTGKWSVKLEVRLDPITGDTLKALLVAGGQYEAPGMAYNHRPMGFKFYYKHNRRDTAVAAIFLTKWNTVTKRRDTIGAAFTFFIDSTNTFTLRNLPITYSSTVRPDTCIAVFAASLKEKPNPGNYLVIDDLALTGFLSNDELQRQDRFSCYPNPLKNSLFIETHEAIAAVSVWATDGKLAASGNSSSLDIDLLAPGVYIVQVQFANGAVAAQRVVKE